MQVNRRENINPVVQKIDTIVMRESEKLLVDLESEASDLACLIDIMRDRMIQSTEVSYPIALAKLGELKLQAFKQRNDVLKNLTSYKNAETSSNKKGPGELSISDLMNSAAFGAGMGAKLNMSGQTQPKLIEDGIERDLIDVHIENISTELPSAESAADTLMKDFS